MSVSVLNVLVVFSTVLDLRAAESRVLRHEKLLHCTEASRKPRALSWDRIHAIGALAHGLYQLSNPSAPVNLICDLLIGFGQSLSSK